MWVKILLFVFCIWCSAFPLELPPDPAAESFRDCHVRVPEGHVLLITSGDIGQDLLVSVYFDLLQPTRNTVTQCDIKNCPRMAMGGPNKYIAFRWVVVLYPSLHGMDQEQLLSFLIESPNWDTCSKIVFIFEDPQPFGSTVVMDLLNNFINSGIFNIGILQPGRPCQLITSEPFSNQLRVTEDPRVLDPKHGKWHYDLHGHHLTVYDVEIERSFFESKQPAYAHGFSIDRLIPFWNATRTYVFVEHKNDTTFVANWTRSDVVSKFRHVLNSVAYLIGKDWVTDMTPLVYELSIDHELLLTSIGLPDDWFFIHEVFINRHSLTLFLVFVLWNALYLIYSRCHRGAERRRKRTSVVQHFFDTLPLCSWQSMNFTADTVAKRTFFVGFVTTLFFLSNIFNCHVTSSIVELNVRMQIQTLQDVVDRGIPIVAHKTHETLMGILLREAKIDPDDARVIFTEDYDLRNISEPNVVFFLRKHINLPVYPQEGFKRISLENGSGVYYWTSYIMPPHSPYLDDFQYMRTASFEAAILRFMLFSHPNQRDIMVLHEQFRDENSGSLQLHQIWFAVKVYLILLTVAFLVFLGEFFNERIRFSWRNLVKKARQLKQVKTRKKVESKIVVTS